MMTGERANLMAQWGTASIVGMIRGVRSEAWPRNLTPRQVATFEELLRACLYDQEALRRVL